jgi:hypothetical protein
VQAFIDKLKGWSSAAAIKAENLPANIAKFRNIATSLNKVPQRLLSRIGLNIGAMSEDEIEEYRNTLLDDIKEKNRSAVESMSSLAVDINDQYMRWNSSKLSGAVSSSAQSSAPSSSQRPTAQLDQKRVNRLINTLQNRKSSTVDIEELTENSSNGDRGIVNALRAQFGSLVLDPDDVTEYLTQHLVEQQEAREKQQGADAKRLDIDSLKTYLRAEISELTAIEEELVEFADYTSWFDADELRTRKEACDAALQSLIQRCECCDNEADRSSCGHRLCNECRKHAPNFCPFCYVEKGYLTQQLSCLRNQGSPASSASVIPAERPAHAPQSIPSMDPRDAVGARSRQPPFMQYGGFGNNTPLPSMDPRDAVGGQYGWVPY